MRIVIMRIKVFLILICSLFECGCAAMIFAIGEEESNIVNSKSTYDSISGLVGSRPALTSHDPAIPVDHLRVRYPELEIMIWSASFYENGARRKNQQEVKASKFASFTINGRIERKAAVGESIALSGYTLFFAELVLIPMALSHQMKAGDSMHKVDVWFDENENIIGYLWQENEPYNYAL